MGHQTTSSVAERSSDRQNRRVGQSANRALVDDVGQAIIEKLQQDGRRPYATIGKAVGLSEAAVRQRVQKLIEAGVVQIVAVTDPIQVGLHRQAMIAIQTSGEIGRAHV